MLVFVLVLVLVMVLMLMLMLMLMLVLMSMSMSILTLMLVLVLALALVRQMRWRSPPRSLAWRFGYLYTSRCAKTAHYCIQIPKREFQSPPPHTIHVACSPNLDYYNGSADEKDTHIRGKIRGTSFFLLICFVTRFASAQCAPADPSSGGLFA
jgi:hypothetical protein